MLHNVIVLYLHTIHIQLYSVDQSVAGVAYPYLKLLLLLLLIIIIIIIITTFIAVVFLLLLH